MTKLPQFALMEGTLLGTKCTLHTIQPTLLHYTVYTVVHSALCIVHCALCSVLCTVLCTVHIAVHIIEGSSRLGQGVSVPTLTPPHYRYRHSNYR